jgi:putative transposase
METLFYRRKLPHWQPLAANFFVTTRLYGSIPIHLINQIKAKKEQLLSQSSGNKEDLYNAQKRYFGWYDDILDLTPNEPYYLEIPAIAEIIKESLHHRDGKDFTLWAYCIMSNHIHFLITTYDTNTHYLYKIMQDFKKYTGREANRILGRTGNPFWEEEYYDHLVRDEAEFYRIENYILMNPVKAGLVKNQTEWPWNYTLLQK